jgi:hypothetical protein
MFRPHLGVYFVLREDSRRTPELRTLTRLVGQHPPASRSFGDVGDVP